MRSKADIYFQRFAFCGRQIATSPAPDLGLVVVIPSFNEPDLIDSLESLWTCERPGCASEVIVVINSPADCAADIRAQNEKTLAQAAQWIACHRDPRLAFHLLHFPDLPPKQAGVGLARKIGMDEAARRLDDVGQGRNGIIVGFDADCRCERNYLLSIARHFQQYPRSPGCSIYFEHPLTGPLIPEVYEAIAAYELHLRYYVQALRYAGFPHAHHTIGSCMAVRAAVYKRQGGMNKRQAGEDFYFLHKIIPLGGFTDLTETTVFPSPRASDRVPFGTGKAVSDYLRGPTSGTYPLQAFLDLKALLSCLPKWCAAEVSSAQIDSLPESVRSFLAAQKFPNAFREIRENTSSEAAFRKRFFHWLNAFQVMKFIHHARDHFYGEENLAAAARRLLELLPVVSKPRIELSTVELLKIYRELDGQPQRASNRLTM